MKKLLVFILLSSFNLSYSQDIQETEETAGSTGSGISETASAGAGSAAGTTAALHFNDFANTHGIGLSKTIINCLSGKLNKRAEYQEKLKALEDKSDDEKYTEINKCLKELCTFYGQANKEEPLEVLSGEVKRHTGNDGSEEEMVAILSHPAVLSAILRMHIAGRQASAGSAAGAGAGAGSGSQGSSSSSDDEEVEGECVIC